MSMDIYIKQNAYAPTILIADCKNISFNHVLKYTPTILQKLNVCVDPYGENCKALYLINAPNYMQYLIDLLLKILNPTVIKEIKVYTGGIESLYGIVSKSILPEDYGGEQPSMNTLADMWMAQLIENKEWLQKQEKITANESLRSNSVINPKDLFGVQGTFRKLDID